MLRRARCNCSEKARAEGGAFCLPLCAWSPAAAADDFGDAPVPAAPPADVAEPVEGSAERVTDDVVRGVEGGLPVGQGRRQEPVI